MNIIKKAVRSVLRETAREKKKYFTSAIIVAAGKSTRTSGPVAKQLVEICGSPVIAHTVRAFDRCDDIREIVIVAAESELPFYDGFAERYGIKKPVRVVTGSVTRDKSVLAGFEAIDKRAEFVAIHDGARCLIKQEDITRVVKKAYAFGAAIAAAPSTDTLKRVNDSGIITETTDRSKIFRAQTPQVFMKEIYSTCVYAKHDDSLAVTDDSMLAEAAGYKVRIVSVGAYNIKITTDEDFYIAEKIMKGEDRK